MIVFRLTKKKYPNALEGKGASLKGGRWNTAGLEVIYTAGNRSLAMAEVAVHFSIGTLPSDYLIHSIFIPDQLSLERLDTSGLPQNWNIFPYTNSTQAIGDQFLFEKKHCILQVPSSVTPGDFNFLINP
ncbi:MAG: RES family NAD+ phosphorylase, partial [Saprospiraceae bacterium]